MPGELVRPAPDLGQSHLSAKILPLIDIEPPATRRAAPPLLPADVRRARFAFKLIIAEAARHVSTHKACIMP
ncbi:unnamed protein product, partial [Iphiclides podalirius]